MEVYIQVNGKTTAVMVKDSSNMLKEVYTRANLSRTELTEKEFLTISMDRNMRVNGETISLKVLV